MRALVIGGASLVLAALSLTVAVAPANAINGGNVGVTWTIRGLPEEGVRDLTFPMTVGRDAAKEDGIYYAQQYTFVGGGLGYIGLQPRRTVDGVERMRAVFSSFVPGTTTSDPNCVDGADGGAGVSCGFEFDAVYGDTYDMTVAKADDGQWVGTATNTVTGESTHIGSWRIPTEALLDYWQFGFVEYYAGDQACDQLRRADITFGAPTTSIGATGDVQSNGEYYRCIGLGGYESQAVGNGVHITRGKVEAPAVWGTLVSRASGQCIDIPGSGFTRGVQPAMWRCGDNQVNQVWSLESSGQVVIKGFCLQPADTAPGARVSLQDCLGTEVEQQWELANGTIRSVESGLCLQIASGGTSLELAACDGSLRQGWTVGGSDPEYRIEQTKTVTLASAGVGALEVRLAAGDEPTSSRMTFTAPTGTRFTGDVHYSGGSSGTAFQGVLSDDGRTLDVSLDMIAGFGDTVVAGGTVYYSLSVQADDVLLVDGLVQDGSWSSGDLSGALEFTAVGADVPVVDVAVIAPGIAGGTVAVGVLGAVLMRRRSRLQTTASQERPRPQGTGPFGVLNRIRSGDAGRRRRGVGRPEHLAAERERTHDADDPKDDQRKRGEPE